MSEAQPLSFRWPKEFIARIDAERGDVSRSLWVRKAVEQALDGPAPESLRKADELIREGSEKYAAARAVEPELHKAAQRSKRAKTTQTPCGPLPSPPAAPQKPTGALPNRGLTAEEARRYRQSVPGPNVENIRSSAQVKDFKPYPKGGKRS